MQMFKWRSFLLPFPLHCHGLLLVDGWNEETEEGERKTFQLACI